jgi:hypothetical protein
MSLIGTDLPAASTNSITPNRLSTAQKLNQTSSGTNGNTSLQTVFSGTTPNSTNDSDSDNTNSSSSSVPVVNPTNADESSAATAEAKIQANLTPNSLNGYDQATYFITFSIVSDDVNNSQQIIIAQTGDTNINISSLVLEVHPAVSAKTRNTTASTMTLTLFESQGSNLPDLLVISAQALGIKNYTKSLLRINLRFQGYDPITGQPNTNIGDRDWQWTCVLATMSSKVSEAGSSHVLSLGVMSNFVGTSDRYAKLPQALSAIRTPNATVGNALNAVIQKMNADIIKTYGYAHVTYAVDQVPYRNSIITGISNPFDNPIYNDNPYYQSSRNSDNIHISGGTSFMSFVDHIFASSPTATKMVASSNRVHDTDNQKNLDVVSIFHMVDTLVTYGAFNSAINDYDKNITYVIRPYETVRVFTNMQQANESTDATKTQQKANFLVQNGYITKGYDYVYTGTNTDVLEFNIDLNFNYSLVSDSVFGEVHYHQTTVAKSYNTQAAQRTYITPTDMANTSTAVSPQNTDSSSSTSITPTTTTSIGNRLTTQNKLTSNQSTATYADDLATLTTTTFNSLPIAISQGGVNHRAQVNSFTESDWSSQRSIYGLLLDQLYENGNSDGGALANISITIRGDPFWLGNDLDDKIAATYAGSSTSTNNGPSPGSAISNDDNASSTVGNNSNTTNSQTIASNGLYQTSTIAASYLTGENVFVFRFNYPQGYNENTGIPSLSESDMFTGFYVCHHVTNTFQDGQFTQLIEGARIVGMQVSQLLKIQDGL